VAQAGDGDEAIERARELQPDVIFMDINMPDLNGLEATRAIKAESPDTTIVILTVSEDERDLFEAIKSGAQSYLLKDLNEEKFEEMIRRISDGEPALSPGLARKLLREFAEGDVGQATADPDGKLHLHNRPQMVVWEIEHGITPHASNA